MFQAGAPGRTHEPRPLRSRSRRIPAIGDVAKLLGGPAGFAPALAESRSAVLLLHQDLHRLAGAPGFEPGTSGFRGRRSSAELRPDRMARLTGLEPEPTDYLGITPGRAAIGNALPFRTVIGPCRCNHARPLVCKSASALNGTLRHSFWVCTFPVVRQALAMAVQAGLEPAALALTGRRSAV